MIKSQIRVLGIDDSPFAFDDEYVLVVGALVRLPMYVEAVLSTRIKVDGIDSTDKLIEMINNSHYKEQTKYIMIDGITLGGFNVVDVEKLYKSTGIPVITITRELPDKKSMLSALQKYFPDWEYRFNLIDRCKLIKIPTKHKPIYLYCSGAEISNAIIVIEHATVRGALPEPLRLAHIISTGIVRGESYGRA